MKDYIVVADWYERSLRVYSWLGEELCVWSRQQLGLAEGDYILGIHGSHQHRLVLAAGKYDVTSLHLYDIK